MNVQDVILIRRATLDDLPALVALELACFAIPWSEQSLRNDLLSPSTAHYFVAEQNQLPAGQIVGYVACYYAADHAQITNLAVAPEVRNRGVGGRLLEVLLEWAKSAGLATVDLEVRPSNLPAIALYNRAGFSIVGRRPRYYADNDEDANIMLKKLT